ncbi:hypothetical protein [Burkholderia pseudomallei]|uniref:hypothetical protein n=1 Tax=Burkholderia pseudomallei TaxID=28450 RepID=UPI0006AD6400|nr:hypothetical protein [Burkholderia pseudomallei]ALB94496.1 hypothetical protein AM256_13355 [Burkholderia pseudomallei]ALC00568.1 hypothetical protein AM257_13380 [Burkholderia pseudomallei]MBF3536958.1 hypothetical protein [Burkholderia pseudomallei]MBF3555905.1 hypothetical protein [Burkholderia pseudomallei]MBF3602588.1 hypothetical protein [Burkholderia pseudomallei]
MTKANRRRVDRLLLEYCAGAPAAAEHITNDVFERELQMILKFGTQDEIAELIAIGEREMTCDGDEARADEIHDAIEARAQSSGCAWTRRRI